MKFERLERWGSPKQLLTILASATAPSVGKYKSLSNNHLPHEAMMGQRKGAGSSQGEPQPAPHRATAATTDAVSKFLRRSGSNGCAGASPAKQHSGVASLSTSSSAGAPLAPLPLQHSLGAALSD